MITALHGSPVLFDRFNLSKASEGTGIKFGYGIYLTDSEASAAHYSQPRDMAPQKDHYIYTVEIPDLTEDNHLVSAKPVNPVIVKRTEAKIGQPVPKKITEKGKEFRKWIGRTLTESTQRDLESEKAAAQFLDEIGVFCNVWPQAQSKPDGLKNYAVFNADNVRIVKVEHIDIERKGDKNVLVEGSKKQVM